MIIENDSKVNLYNDIIRYYYIYEKSIDKSLLGGNWIWKNQERSVAW